METDYEKRGYLLEDFRLFHLTDVQGTKVDFHYHEFCKLLLLRSGSGSYSVDGRRYTLVPGDIVRVDRRCIHRPEFEEGAPYERTILYISPSFLQTHSEQDCNLEECFADRNGHVLRPRDGVRSDLFQICDRLEEELSAGQRGRVIVSSSLVLTLLVQLLRTMDSQDGENIAPVQSRNRRVLDILRYLDEHLAEDISIDALAEQFYLSKYHMMRLFRRETGSSIHEYLTDRRLLYARDLMDEGVSATDACFRSGWHSYSSFTRAYDKRFGTTPTGRTGAVLADPTYE